LGDENNGTGVRIMGRRRLMAPIIQCWKSGVRPAADSHNVKP